MLLIRLGVPKVVRKLCRGSAFRVTKPVYKQSIFQHSLTPVLMFLNVVNFGVCPINRATTRFYLTLSTISPVNYFPFKKVKSSLGIFRGEVT